MPELPDVQVFKEYLDATSLHQPIEKVEVRRDDVLGNVSARSLQRRLKGRTLASTDRHGKYLFAEVDDDEWLVLHFGMTGRLAYSKTGPPPEHTRVLIRFDNGAHLAYVCVRMLGRVDWTDDPENFIHTRELGIDALSDDLDFPRFRELLESKRGSIKSALTDQQMIAGLGNVYTDEILFQAHIYPKTNVADFDEKRLKEIHRQLKRVLAAAIRARVDPNRMPKSFLLPHRGEEDAKCPRCGTPLKAMKIAGRTTYFCRKCQPA